MDFKSTARFRISVKGGNESQNYTTLDCMKVTLLTDVVYQTIVCVCLCWSTDDEVDFILRLSTALCNGNFKAWGN